MFNFLTVLGTPEVPVFESKVDCVFNGSNRRPMKQNSVEGLHGLAYFMIEQKIIFICRRRQQNLTSSLIVQTRQ